MTERMIPNVPLQACGLVGDLHHPSEFEVARFSMPRVSGTSPASIVMKFTPRELHPWKVFWFNVEYGGYSNGGYHETYQEALDDFIFRVKTYGFYTGFEPQWQLLGAGSLPLAQKESEVYGEDLS